jgi:GT2 family glycosyltransferase
MAKDAVLLTVFDRPKDVLFNTLAGLARNDLTDTVVICVDDGSSIDYVDLEDFVKTLNLPLIWSRVDTVKERPGTYNINGYNNPAHAFNAALKIATGEKAERVFILSSDCVLPAHALEAWRRWVDIGYVPIPKVVDHDSQQVYASSSRIWPLYWWMGCRMEWIKGIGGWDEEYLRGIAFEDNDFAARLFDKVQKFVFDDSVMVIHQSHSQTAYSDNLEGWAINKQYTLSKYGANPWERNGEGLLYNPRPVRQGPTYVLHPEIAFPDRAPQEEGALA